MNTFHFRKAEFQDAEDIWTILQQGIERRKKDGSPQWQQGYPNPDSIKSDILKGAGFVLTDHENIAAYCAVILNDEPAYQTIKGKWLSDGDFYVIHRVAVADEYIGKGLAKRIFKEAEEFARNNSVFSIKVDTNFDNEAMLAVLEKLGYQYCGEVEMRGAARMAFEKLLENLIS
ncbi:MAG: GNAT family N-acetyltransferase [Bergeyella sp.]